MTLRIASLFLVTVAGGFAQQLSFDSASVKQSSARPGRGASSSGPASLSLQRSSLKLLIAKAYDVPIECVVGGPEWTETERFDIEARSGAPATQSEKMEMLRALLAGRFQLRTHKETRIINAYALILAKGGPKLGSQFHGLTEGEAVPGSQPGLLVFRGTLPQFAHVISDAVISGRIIPGPGQPPLTPPEPLPVVDLTDITGAYVITVDLRQVNDWFEVLEPQLGLKLAPRKVPTDVIVIDAASRPEAN